MSSPDPLEALSPEELAALRAAGAWYASYHAREIAAEAQDTSAYAVEERRQYLALVAGLGKLGVTIALPDALGQRRRLAA